MKTLFITIILLLIFNMPTIALSEANNTGTIQGYVFDENNKPLAFATVGVKDSNFGTVTNIEGFFKITTSVDKELQLIVRCVGYEELITTVKLNHNNFCRVNLQLKSSNTDITEVVVAEKSETTIKKEMPYAVTAISAKPLQIRNLDVNGILGTTTGIKIREEGGLGSGFKFSLNGFSGNQIKFFIDGIPMENFGSSLTLNNIPVNLISSIEVYKGVVPVELGIDALGGAVNIITNQNTKQFLDVSYSFGSFNTHRTSIISRYTLPKSNLLINVNAFHNYSDNNYKILAEVPDPVTGSIGEPVEVRRFNDAYQSITGQVELGVINKKFADQLLLGVVTSKNYKEVQTGYNMTKVAGDVHKTNDRVILTLKYAKSDLFIKNLDAKISAIYLHGHDYVVDTSSRQYDWYGNYTIKEFGTSGELNWDKTKFRFNDKSSTNTANLCYSFSPNNSISINNTYIYFNRVGEDPISYNAVPFSIPNTLNKNITGVAYNQSLFKDKLKTSVFVKFFFMYSNMYEQAESGSDDELNNIISKNTNTGYGVATTYFITKYLQSKISFENTYRLPETEELFGDGLNLRPYPHLLPEESINLNFRLLLNKRFGKNSFIAEGTYLYRLPENLIKLIAEGNAAWYENYSKAKINSFEADLKYRFDNKIMLNINGTYQNIIDNNKTTEKVAVNYLYGVRLPNKPYLFGNASLGYQFKLIGSKQNKASIDWNTHFVEAFYLKSPNQGYADRKNEIPQQLSHSLSVSFLFNKDKYNVSFACTNLTNSILYDNFKLQKPGRAFSIKLRYYISNS